MSSSITRSSSPHRFMSLSREKHAQRSAGSVVDGAATRLMGAVAAASRAASSRRHSFEDGSRGRHPIALESAAAGEDAGYFRRRAAQERAAAGEAACPQARAAHQELAARYAVLAERVMRPHGFPRRERRGRSGTRREVQRVETGAR